MWSQIIYGQRTASIVPNNRTIPLVDPGGTPNMAKNTLKIAFTSTFNTFNDCLPLPQPVDKVHALKVNSWIRHCYSTARMY